MTSNWVSFVPRVILMLAVLSYGNVGLFYLIEPAFIGRLGIEVTNPAGFTSVRVGIGGFHIGVAMIALYCVAARERVSAGLAIASVMTGVVVATRLGGLIANGFDQQVVGLMTPEAMLLLIFAGAALMQLRLEHAAEKASP